MCTHFFIFINQTNQTKQITKINNSVSNYFRTVAKQNKFKKQSYEKRNI